MSNDRWRVGGISLAIVGLIVAVYFPVYHAHFVWDDRIYVHDTAWLRSGSSWLRHALQAFFASSDYFRPLGIAVFAAEAMLFNVAPGPAHLLSLSLHVANTLCVGALAWRLLDARNVASKYLPLVAMLLFSLHPLSIEPVVWISSQFELLVTFFTLLGLILNLALRGVMARSLAVATCFFLAACTKESAISFPVLLLVLDWMMPTIASAGRQSRDAVFLRLREQVPVYAAIAVAGLAYLLLRRWGLGYLVHSAPHIAVFSLQRLQLVSFTYLTYWRQLVWPMTGLGPLHIVPYEQFAAVTVASVAIDAAAIGLFALGVQQLWRRRSLGGLIVGVTAALLPVLHILPVEFDDSYYHDRYAMMAIAIACSFLPVAIHKLVSEHRGLMLTGASIGVLWLLAAMINIRATLPLWSDEILLWQWVLRENPHSTLAQVNLFALYLDNGDLGRARALALELEKMKGQSCANCMLNLANLAIVDGDADRANTALEEAKEAMTGQVVEPRQMVGIMVATGNIRKLKGDLPGAEDAYRDAISSDPEIPTTYMSLVIALAAQGKLDDARKTAEEGLALFAPDDRPRQRQRIEKVIAASTTIAPALPEPPSATQPSH